MRSYLLAMLLVITACAAPPVTLIEPPVVPPALASPVATATQAATAVATPPPAIPSALPEPTPTALAPTPTAVPPPDPQAAALLPGDAADLANALAWDSYSLAVRLDPDAFVIEGSETVTFTNRTTAPVTALYFHLYANHPALLGSLTVAEARLDGLLVEPAYEQSGILLRLDRATPLDAGASTVVDLAFRTTTPSYSSGAGYGAFNYEAGVWNMASFFPILALHGEEGWDTAPVDVRGDLVNSATSLFRVRVDAPVDWALATTGVLVADERVDERQVATFVSGPQRDFFLAAMQGLDQASAMVDGVRVTSYYRPEHAAGGQRALEAAVQSVALFNQRFGRYPLAELDVVEIAATNFLGVEYPGIVLIEQGLYSGSASLDVIVAHEVAHQWWYSLVGNDVQQEAWLDEALASYAQIVYQESVAGAGAAEEELESFRARYRRVRNAGDDTIVAQPTGAFPPGTYYPIVYGKAPLFVHTLRLQLGDDAFYRFLQTYYTTSKYTLSNGSQFLGSAEAVCGCELDQLYTDWITTVAPVAIP